MARGDPQLSSFTSGELSQYAMARVDAERYARGAESLSNFIVGPAGTAFHRPGTQYIGGTSSNLKAALLPFVASTGNEFVLEVVGTTTRFWYGPGRRLVYNNAGTWNITSTGAIATLSTPWAAADLFDTDGSLRLKFVQINDVMWIVHPSYTPYKITRTATYEFVGAFISDGINASTPFDDINPSQTTTLQFAAATGAGVNCTASVATFTAGDVGGWLLVERPRNDSTRPWQASTALTLNNVYSSNGRYYNAGSTATSGTVRPTHLTGIRNDGTIDMEYYDDGYGIAAITGFTSTTVVVCTIVRRIPNTCVSGGSTRWARGAWRTSAGFPSSIALFRERLCFGRGQTVWTSMAGDFENFTATEGGIATPDSAITATIGSDRADRIKWMQATQAALIIGTASSEFAMSEQTSAEAFGPGNVRAAHLSGYGVNGVQPIPIGNSLMFVERGGRRTREMRYSVEVDSFASRDLNIFADHIWSRGTCAAIAHQRVPFGVVWGITNGGQLKGFTYQPEQEVWAWHTHTLGGTGLGTNQKPAVKSLCSITSPDGTNDDLWLCVERRIAGVTTYYIEILGPHLSYTALGYVSVEDLTDAREAMHLDCGIQKTLLSLATTITGLQHLNGETVTALTDGALVPASLVVSNQITIPEQDEGCKAWVGFARNADLIPVPLIGPPVAGTPQGKKSRVSHLCVRIINSTGFLFGHPTAGTLDRLSVRKQYDDMSAPTPLRSGDYTAPFPHGSYEDEERPRLLIRQDQPFPLIVAGVFPRLNVEA